MFIFAHLPHFLKCDITSLVPKGNEVCKDSRHAMYKRLKRLCIQYDHEKSVLDLYEFSNLETLNIYCCMFDEINASNLTNLQYISINDCIALSRLTLPFNAPILRYLTISSSLYLDKINVAPFDNLVHLEITETEIAHLDLSKNKKLLTLVLTNLFSLAALIMPFESSDLVTIEIRFVDRLQTLDLRTCTRLIELKCCNLFNLQSFDQIQNCKLLRTLDCDFCPKLSLPDFRPFTRMAYFNCMYNTQIYDLNVSTFRYLRKLRCDCTSITTLYTRDCPFLEELDCSGTNLEELDLDLNHRLRKLWCDSCELTHLDLTHNHNLEFLNCSHNYTLSSVKFNQRSKIKCLHANNTVIEHIDWTTLPALQQLFMTNTRIKVLDATPLLNLTHLDCAQNKITELHLTCCQDLVTLVCKDTLLTDIDVSQNPKLKFIDCSDTAISHLDVSNNPHLMQVHIQNTNIQGIDISYNQKLRSIELTGLVVNVSQQ